MFSNTLLILLNVADSGVIVVYTRARARACVYVYVCVRDFLFQKSYTLESCKRVYVSTL